MRSRIGYVLAIGGVMLGVSVGPGQVVGPSGNLTNGTTAQVKMGGTYLVPKGTCSVASNTINPRVALEYGTVDAKGEYTVIADKIGTTLAKNADGTYNWTAADIGPVAAGKTYKVKATLYGQLNSMPPGMEKELASNTVQIPL
jgi:hypothetical protein